MENLQRLHPCEKNPIIGVAAAHREDDLIGAMLFERPTVLKRNSLKDVDRIGRPAFARFGTIHEGTFSPLVAQVVEKTRNKAPMRCSNTLCE
jgi:hypothetical protein